MTHEERITHMDADKTILRARRNPKNNLWEIVYYTGTSFQIWTFDSFTSRTLCESHISILTRLSPNRYISDFSNPTIKTS